MGKSNIYVLELSDQEVHEDEAGVRLGEAIKGNGTYAVAPKESRVNIFAEHDGLLKVNKEAVNCINELPYVIVSTLPDNMRVKKGDMLAGTKVIPLVVDAADIEEAEKDEKGTQMVKYNKESRKKVVKSVRSVCRTVLLCELQ